MVTQLRSAREEVHTPVVQCMTDSQSVDFGDQSGGDGGVVHR